jgi:hypothetical protein
MPIAEELAERRAELRETWRTGHGSGQVIPAHTDEDALQLLATRMGKPIPLAYGRHLVAITPVFQHRKTDGTTILLGALGDGEWDSIEKLWINAKNITLPDTSIVHFHPGMDGEAGTEADPSIRNQKICSFFPGGFTQTTFSRTAYLGLSLASDPTAPGPEFDVRGIFKTRRARLFDDAGSQTAYEYSANPAWELLDAYIAHKLKPYGAVNEALTDAENACIDFAAFYQDANECYV